MRAELDRIRRHVVAGMLAGAAIGLADGIATAARLGGTGTAIAPLVTAAICAWPGALVGLGGYAFDVTVRRLGVAAALARVAPTVEELAARLAALTAAAFALGALAAFGASRFAPVAARLQDEAFAARLTAFAWIVTTAAWLVLVGPLAALLHRMLRRSLRARRAVAVLAWLGALACAAGATALVAFAHADAAPLGVTRAVPYALAVALLLPPLAAPVIRTRVERLARTRSCWFAAAFALGGAAVGASTPSIAQRVVVESPAVALVAPLLAHLTDLDGDGRSALFGELDCAPLDAARGPLAHDLPGNGVDEDCDGHDAARASGRAARSEAGSELPAALTRRYDVVLVVIDAFRADRFLRSRKDTLTPALVALARESLSFTEAFSQSPSTRLSFPSFLTGLAPEELVWRRRNGWLQPDESTPLLAERMQRHGYRTGLVYTRWLRARLPSLRRGYHRVLDARKAQGASVSPALSGPSTNARAIEFLEESTRGGKASQPIFLTLYYDGPHSPYVDWTDAGIAPKSARPIDRYEGELRYVDRQIGHFLDYLRAKPKLWSNAVVVVTSDHGEEFHEHGGTNHDRTCYRESTHVPLVVRVPGLPPAVIDARVGLVDIVPTVLGLVGAAPPEKTSGRMLVRGDADTYATMPDARVTCTYFANVKPMATLVRAVRDERWLYVRDYARGADEVYDTTVDRREQHDLGASGPALDVRRRLAPAARPPEIVDE